MYHYTYVIFNEVTDQYYIGVRSSKVDPHIDPYMGSITDPELHAAMWTGGDWAKYIVETFTSREDADRAEHVLIKDHFQNGNCVNSRNGWLLTEEARIRRAKNSGKTLKARWANDSDFRARTAATHKAVCATPEWQASNSAAQKVKWADPAYKERMREVRREQFTPEVRAKNSAAQKDAQNRPEVKAKRNAAIKAAWTPERQAQHSEAIKAYHVRRRAALCK